jgi:predicted nucleic acid-binding Zn ribbon protein
MIVCSKLWILYKIIDKKTTQIIEVVEMPKLIYKCELCGNPLDTENEAAKCEQSHYATCANPKCGAVFVQIPKTKVVLLGEMPNHC